MSLGHFGNNALEYMKKKEYSIKNSNLKKLVDYLKKTKKVKNGK